MNKRLVSKILLVSSIAGGSYLLGTRIERQRLQENFDKATAADPYLFCNKDSLWKDVSWILVYFHLKT